MSFINAFIPKELQINSKIKRSASLILRVDLAILVLSVVLCFFFFYIDFTIGGYTMLMSFGFAIFFPFLLYQSKNLDLAGHFFSLSSLLVFSGLCIGSGGISSPFLIWFLTIPPIGFVYLKKKNAKLWFKITVANVVLLFLGTIIGLLNYQQLDVRWHPYATLFNFSMLLWLFVSVIRSFNIGYKRMNAKLASSNDQLKQSNEELERFAYIASHDLKSPLRIITSFIQLFENHYEGRLDKIGREYLSFIDQSAKQMNRLIEDILEYSKSNNQEVKREFVDLNEEIYQITHHIKLNSLYTDALIKTNRLPNIYADKTQIHQLFQNLIENGLKYNKSEFPAVEIEYEEENKHHHFRVIDNGIGIDPKFNQQVFEMFKRLHTRDSYQGTGIGLAICKKIVDTAKGEIWLDSTPGKGSTFHITFPKMKERLTQKEQKSVVMDAF